MHSHPVLLSKLTQSWAKTTQSFGSYEKLNFKAGESFIPKAQQISQEKMEVALGNPPFSG